MCAVERGEIICLDSLDTDRKCCRGRDLLGGFDWTLSAMGQILTGGSYASPDKSQPQGPDGCLHLRQFLCYPKNMPSSMHCGLERACTVWSITSVVEDMPRASRWHCSASLDALQPEQPATRPVPALVLEPSRHSARGSGHLTELSARGSPAWL